ncbi:uncharacterized protein LOC110179701 [Drosophila serrata]|uniref:uncharacterized protein LOC110179701 n=1 Tax=Drosophila serrata TaxID=7274 RepID=UPI000A1D3920|nr:uncharacterized protein LOC110179701 [Drosophila serrata]
MSDQIENTQQMEQNLDPKGAYFASLAVWAKQLREAQEAMAGFPGYLLAKYPELFRTPNGGQQTNTLGRIQPRPVQGLAAASARAFGIPPGRARRLLRHRILNRGDQQNPIDRRGGYVVALAPLWKRAVAQAIDMYLLLLLKVLIAHLLACQFPSIGEQLIWRVITDDLVMYYFGITTSTQALLVRMFLKLVGFCYEPLWTSYCNGATPGKWLMKIRIVTACAVMPFSPPDGPSHPRIVFVYPAWRLTMQRAIFRSLIKRFVTTIILPISIRFVFRRHRAYYDQWTNTIVLDNKFKAVHYLGVRNRYPR